ncbi:hypothetical protein [Rhodovulum visakhapatnamense]|uniref:Phosphotransferase family enzyme n=1 Tax=Rhodovulum visakhapatnamense TaxID=364297 RepID=A0A4R8G1H1_9RHOB|nr:hypothetical protein [Rhodovulum visakhapatnamense]TDX33595.1 hypothetical protein EV657_10123 [Rhodovulum visakhapatnamense]
MARSTFGLECLLDAPHEEQETQARRPGFARFAIERVTGTDARKAVFVGRQDGHPAELPLLRGAKGPERAHAFHRDLQRLALHMGHDPVRVPPRVAAWPGKGLPVQRLTEGRPMCQALAGPERDEMIGRAGGWLAHLVSTERRRLSFGGRYWLRRRGAELAAKRAQPTDRRLADELSNRLEALLTTVAGRPITQARWSGDFRPRNLLLRDGAVYGLASGDPGRMQLVRDTARFLVALRAGHPRAETGDIRFGFHGADLDALLAPIPAIPAGERALHLPFFIGVELAGAFALCPPDLPETAALCDAIGHFLGGIGPPTL